jgi:hypothetical protein
VVRREAILARLFDVILGIEGVKAAVRNAADVPGLARPAVILHDGREEFSDRPQTARYSQIQRVDLTPAITINAGAEAANIGTLLNLIWARLLQAIPADPELRQLVGSNGFIRYGGCERLQAGPESKEGRLEVTFVFTYVLSLDELASS